MILRSVNSKLNNNYALLILVYVEGLSLVAIRKLYLEIISIHTLIRSHAKIASTFLPDDRSAKGYNKPGSHGHDERLQTSREETYRPGSTVQQGRILTIRTFLIELHILIKNRSVSGTH